MTSPPALESVGAKLKRRSIAVWILSVLLCTALMVLFVVLLAVLRYPVPIVMVRHWLRISERPQYTITYYDRNHDGEVDLEIHQADATDSDWGLTDTDFKGFYNELWVNGVAGHSYPVQVPIPGGVPIAKEVPEKYRSPNFR